MKINNNDYNTVFPNIVSLLSDDYLYFEGVERPQAMYMIMDNRDAVENNVEILEKYFNDLYNLFLRKLSNLTILNSINIEDTSKLQALLQELIKVKNLIIKTSESKK